MICVSGVVLTFFCVLAVIFAGAGGFVAYYYLLSAGLKQHAELVFYCVIVAVMSLVFLYSIILVRAKNRTNELRHILDMARSGGKVDDTRFMKFGALGQGIKTLFRQSDDISSKRAQRIRYLTNAIMTLMSVANEPILLLDAEGIVMQVSPAYLEKYAESGHASETYGSSIEKLHPEIDFPALSQKMMKNHSAVNVPSDKINAQLLPIFTTNQSPDGYLAVFGKNSLFTIAANKVAGKAAEWTTEKDIPQSAVTETNARKDRRNILGLIRNIFGKQENKS